MGHKISRWFTREEVACHCGCGFDTMDAETLRIADEVRDYVGVPIAPTSGARCLKHNRSVGSTDQSQHVIARAIDLPVPDPMDVYNWLCDKYPDRYGFGVYVNSGFVHVDSRRGPARWTG